MDYASRGGVESRTWPRQHQTQERVGIVSAYPDFLNVIDYEFKLERLRVAIELL